MTVFDGPCAKELLGLLKKRLPEKTFKHVISVTEMMVRLVEPAALDHEQAVTAGLLHDLCKTMKPDELLKRAKEYGIRPNAAQKAKPNLLHGPVAAEEGRRKLKIRDEAVYEAVYYHTVGKPGWCRLGLALYVADFSEPLRDHPEAAEARLILDTEGFDAALCYVAQEKWAHVQTKAHVDPATLAFHQWLRQSLGCRP